MSEEIFTVKGKGRFPIDMLRYDGCWPYSGQDAAAIEATMDPMERKRIRDMTDDGCITVKLVKHSRQLPTVERWRSLGWKVCGF